MSQEKPIFHLSNGVAVKYDSIADAAREFKFDTKAFRKMVWYCVQRSKPIEYKGEHFRLPDVVVPMKNGKRHVFGQPLLVGNPKHHIGTWHGL